MRFKIYLKGVYLELGECVAVEVFGSCAHCAHSIYSPQESGPGPSWAGAADAAGAAGAAGCHSRTLTGGNKTGRRPRSQTWGLCL